MTDICECCGQLTSSMTMRGKSRNLTIEQQAEEIERLQEIILRMDGLIDSGEAALANARQAAKEALND